MSDTPKKAEFKDSPRGRVAQAYARVFGRNPAHRDDDQRVVWEDMERRGFCNRPVLQRNAQGVVIEENTLSNAGKQEFHQDTALLVFEGCSLDPEAKPKTRGKSITK